VIKRRVSKRPRKAKTGPFGTKRRVSCIDCCRKSNEPCRAHAQRLQGKEVKEKPRQAVKQEPQREFERIERGKEEAGAEGLMYLSRKREDNHTKEDVKVAVPPASPDDKWEETRKKVDRQASKIKKLKKQVKEMQKWMVKMMESQKSLEEELKGARVSESVIIEERFGEPKKG